MLLLTRYFTFPALSRVVFLFSSFPCIQYTLVPNCHYHTLFVVMKHKSVIIFFFLFDFPLGTCIIIQNMIKMVDRCQRSKWEVYLELLCVCVCFERLLNSCKITKSCIVEISFRFVLKAAWVFAHTNELFRVNQ